MKLPFDRKHLGFGIVMFLVIAASILFYVFLQNFSIFKNFIKTMLNILSPVMYGFVIAYLLNPLLRFLENKLFLPMCKKFKRLKNPEKLSRALGVFTTLIISLGAVVALFWLVIPQLITSISSMTLKFPDYINKTREYFDGVLKSNPALLEYSNSIFESTIIPYLNNLKPQIASFAQSMAVGAYQFASWIINISVGIIVSIYIMYSKETFASQFKRVCYALFSKEFCKRFLNAADSTDKVFGKYISGKILDSVIVGIICFIVCVLIGIPYAALVSVLVGVTNIIPFFGPFFGAVPSAFIILLEDPMKALIFVIFIIFLQQIDGNVLCPIILGDSTGLSAFWVITAILVGGGLFGILGMFISVPIFAVIYTFVKSFIDVKLEKKQLPISADAYKGNNNPDI